MTQSYKCIICGLILLTTNSILHSQSKTSLVPYTYQKYTNHDPNFIISDSLSFYQRKSVWRQIIDDFWGAGDPLEEKRHIFNTYANYIQNNFPSFNGSNVDWDSLRSHYYSQIDDSMSKGRFSALMRNLAIPLKVFHLWAWDEDIQATALNPGTPLYILYETDASHFGAGLSALPDSSLLVVNVVPDHPLGLVPGDIVIGYEGVPWKKLTFELLNSDIPKVGPIAASESAILNTLLTNAGLNWHLFNSIDIVKYASVDTLHLATDTLLTLNPSEKIYNNPQVMINGIRMPEFDRNQPSDAVSYGLIENTNIGYIYLTKHNYTNVDTEFNEAITALMHTDALIIDIRVNFGGFQNIFAGLSQLFNFNTQTLSGLGRCSNDDLYSLCSLDLSSFFYLTNNPYTFYDKPIAVLKGPNTISFGDIDVFTFKLHPMTRSFGKANNGAFAGALKAFNIDGWNTFCPDNMLVDYNNPNEQLVRKEMPADEAVWLEADDVANGEDTVVKKALEWIESLSYAHDVALDKNYVSPGMDSVLITAQLENPGDHDISLNCRIYKADSSITDSLEFFDDGIHDDGLAANNIWGNHYLPIPSEEHIYKISITTNDETEGTSRTLPAISRFTTIGPLVLGDIPYLDLFYNESFNRQYINIILRNLGNSTTAENIKVKVKTSDPRVEKILYNNIEFPDLSAGEIDTSAQLDYIVFDFAEGYNRDSTLGNPVAFDVSIYSNNYSYWTDSFEFEADTITTVLKDKITIIDEFKLFQNYPNPFNPRTNIEYSVRAQHAVPQHVNLSIYNILGQKVATLVNKKQPAGNYQVQWDASGFASGIYIYQLKAKSQEQNAVLTKKLVLLK